MFSTNYVYKKHLHITKRILTVVTFSEIEEMLTASITLR